MGWNLELACVRVTSGATVNQVVPDVFTPTGKHLGLEDATVSCCFQPVHPATNSGILGPGWFPSTSPPPRSSGR